MAANDEYVRYRPVVIQKIPGEYIVHSGMDLGAAVFEDFKNGVFG